MISYYFVASVNGFTKLQKRRCIGSFIFADFHIGDVIVCLHNSGTFLARISHSSAYGIVYSVSPLRDDSCGSATFTPEGDKKLGKYLNFRNGANVEGATHKQVVQQIKNGGDRLQMVVISVEDPDMDRYGSHCRSIAPSGILIVFAE